MKYLSPYLFFVCTAALIFAGCTGDEAAPKYESGKSIVSFNVLGVEDDEDVLRSGSTPTDIAVDTVSLGDDLSLVLTLKEDGGEAGITRGTPVALGDNVRYRFIAYNSSTGAYMDHADYTAHDYSPALELWAGDSYNLVGYSYNSTTALPETSAAIGSTTWNTAGTLARLTGVPAGTDLLHWTGVYNNIPSGNQTIPVTFKHKFSQINVQAVVSEISGATISSFTNVTISPNYNADMRLYDGYLSTNGTAQSSSVTVASGLNTSTAKTTYAIVYAPSGSFTVSFSITINGTTYPISQTYTQVLVSGKKYTLQANFKNPAVDPSTLPVGVGTLTGRTCYDVRQTEWSTGSNRGSLAVRNVEYAAAGSNSYSYTSGNYVFTPTGQVSNVRFMFVNATTGGMVETISGNNTANNIVTPVTGVVNFRANLVAAATLKKLGGNTYEEPLKTRVYAVYNDGPTNNGIDRAVYLDIYAVDQGCCGASLSNANGWQTFMCHNLGATTSANPFIPAKALHGNYYKWGYSTPTATPDTPSGPISGWDTSNSTQGLWQDASKTANDPCPPGWRVPNRTQWTAVATYGGGSWTGPDLNSPTNFSSGWMFGNTLFLPAAGARSPVNDNGELGYRGNNGLYWSTTRYLLPIFGARPDHYYTFNFNTSEGVIISSSSLVHSSGAISVRCIAL